MTNPILTALFIICALICGVSLIAAVASMRRNYVLISLSAWVALIVIFLLDRVTQ